MFLFPSNHAPPARSPHGGAAPGSGRSTLSRRLIAMLAMVMTIGGILAAVPVASVEALQGDPVAKITRTPEGAVLEEGATIRLDASQSWDVDGDEIVSYTWEFSGEYLAIFTGEVVEVKLPPEADEVRIRLIITDSNKQRGTATDFFRTVRPKPVPDSTFTPLSSTINVGEKIVFDGTQSCCKHSWKMTTLGDAPKTSKDARFPYTFMSAGNYTIEHTVIDQWGKTSTTTGRVTVKDRSPAAIIYDASSYAVPGYLSYARGDAVWFSGSQSRGNGLTYSWSIDGQAVPANPNDPSGMSFKFNTAGTYEVKLTVTDKDGKTDSATTSVVILNELPKPNATFKQSQASPVPVDTKVTFDGSASTGQAFTYTWYVNGTEVTQGPILNYTFDKAGTYEVKLMVWDSFDKKVYKTTQLQVGDYPTAKFTQTPNTPTVDVNTPLEFDGSSSTGDKLTYAWTVSGVRGLVGDTAVMNYEFTKPGNYNIQLVVTDSGGRSVKERSSVKVIDPTPEPVAKFTQTPNTPTVEAKTPVTFDASTSTGDKLSYLWLVSRKGVAGKSSKLVYEFPGAGNYGVELIVTDSKGRKNKQRIVVKVVDSNKPPTADFTQAPAVSTVPAGTEVTFDGSASKDPDGDKLTYAWYVRGEKGVYNTSSTMKYTFEKAGTYGVELQVKDPSGAWSKKWVKVTVTK